MGWSRPETLRASGPVRLPVSALTRHIAILGATGSGKSTTAITLARGLAAEGISTVVLDRTGEYARALNGLDRAKVYGPGDNLAMALFQYDGAASLSSQVEGWIGLLDHYMAVTYRSQVSPLQYRVLREVLGQYYSGTHDTLTISRLISKLEAYEQRVRRISGWEESIEAVISRLVPLTVDLVGRTFDLPYSTMELCDLFQGSVSVFDMSAIEEDGGKNLLSQMVLKRLYQTMRSGDPTEGVRLVLILDEAQHLAPYGDYISVPERCAIELRKYGFSLVTIATRPSLISPNILSNCGTIISHVLVNDRDIEAVAGYLLEGSANAAVRHALRTLSTGWAVVQKNFPTPERPHVCAVGREALARAETGSTPSRPVYAPAAPAVTPPQGPIRPAER